MKTQNLHINPSTDPQISGWKKTTQQSETYPFGHMIYASDTQTSIAEDNRYLYNGKLKRSGNPAQAGEFKEDFDLNWGACPVSNGNYRARFYDAQIGRFHSVDPLAEVYSFQSPYAYAANNPVLFIDWLGLAPRYNPSTGEYYEDEDGDGEQGEKEKNVDWNYVYNWITEQNAGIELFNSSEGVQNQNFSTAVGTFLDIPFVELGFGPKENREYVRTYLVGKDDLDIALGSNSPFLKEEQLEIFRGHWQNEMKESSTSVLAWTLGLPIAVITGAEFIAMAPVIYQFGLSNTGNIAKGMVTLEKVPYQVGYWLNHTKIGTWTGAVISASAPPGTVNGYPVNEQKEIIVSYLKQSIEFRKEKK